MGSWLEGVRHGNGSYFYRKGDRYEGEWKNDLREGSGVLWSTNGACYQGHFKADKKHGRGEIIMADGTRYIEEWSNGLLISHAKIESIGGDSTFSSNHNRYQSSL